MQFHDYSKPKNGTKFKVLSVGRISTEQQDERSLDDQESFDLDHLRKTMPDAEFDCLTITGQGTRQYFDRKDFHYLCELVATETFDIVMAEDLARILRRMQAFIFCEEAEDVGTRVIAINDFLDTNDESWRQAAFFAAYKHVRFASKRRSEFVVHFATAVCRVVL